MEFFSKLRRRFLYYFSSGSPLRYPRKIFLYITGAHHAIQRRRLISTFKKDASVMASKVFIRDHGYQDVSGVVDAGLMKELISAGTNRLGDSGKLNQVKNRSYFGEYLTAEDRSAESIYTRVALQKNILGLISAHFGQVPQLFGLSLLHSKPVSEDFLEAQLWHRDYDDTKILKLFIYLSDVTSDGDGPFTYIPPMTSKKVGRAFIPKRISDSEMIKAGGDADKRQVFGKKGTAFLIDTGRCYHMGSRCKNSERLAYIATYTTAAPLDRRAPFPKAQNLPPLENLVLQ